MEDTVATVLAIFIVAGIVAFGSYLVGSIVCAVAGLGLGPLLRIGLGLLGLLATAFLYALWGIRHAGWTAWITAPLLAGGFVLLVRRLQQAHHRHAREKGPSRPVAR